MEYSASHCDRKIQLYGHQTTSVRVRSGKRSNRTMVKDAVEKIFDVKVVRVNIINVPAKQGVKAAAAGCWSQILNSRKQSLPLIRKIEFRYLKGLNNGHQSL